MKSILTGVISAAILLGTISSVPRAEAAPSSQSTKFAKCASGVRYNCVIDGDTLWISGHKVRVADPSVRRLPIDGLDLQGDGFRKLRLSDVQLGLDLATLAGVASVTKFGAQFLDLDFNGVGHRLISLSVKDDDSGR